VAYLVYVERRVAAFIQDRLGPNRVGPAGLLQPLADGLKFLLKEELVPAGSNKVVFLLAPVLILAAATLAFATIPFGYYVPVGSTPIALSIAPDMDIGLLFVLAISSLGVYGVILGGWASNNKYSFLGGLRSSAQLVSYELPLGLSVMGVLLLTGTLRMEEMMRMQAATGWWLIVIQPLGFIVFMVSGCAEAARLPFDLPECEQELVAGYHTEYTGMKFGMFALSEYMHMITISMLAVIMFFGGWHFWGLTPDTPGNQVGLGGAILRIIILQVKVFLLIFFFMWIRWSWPRFRYDQLMSIGWKYMIPIGLLNLLVSAIAQEFLPYDAFVAKAVLSWLTLAGCVIWVAMTNIAAPANLPNSGIPARASTNV
jgi:NADH-quinone oxidoreductase subunit H